MSKYTKNSTSKPSYRYAVISISIVLFFLGIYLLLFMQSSKIDQKIKEQINIVVELIDSTDQSMRQTVIESISNQKGVIAGSIEYYDKKSATLIMGANVLDGFSERDSPFRDMFTFRLVAEAYNDENLNDIDIQLQKEPSVFDVFYEHESDVGIHDFVSQLSILFLILSVIFVGLALIIIHNTLSLSLYADRWEIKTMELIGARKSFIRKPYVAHGRIIGQRAFVVAAIALLLTIIIACLSFDIVSAVISWPLVLLVLLILFLLSTVITMISTFTVVNRFLDQKLSDLYT